MPNFTNFFDSTSEGLVPLSPETLRNASDETLEEIIAWMGTLQAGYLKPRSCPFCGIQV